MKSSCLHKKANDESKARTLFFVTQVYPRQNFHHLHTHYLNELSLKNFNKQQWMVPRPTQFLNKLVKLLCGTPLNRLPTLQASSLKIQESHALQVAPHRLALRLKRHHYCLNFWFSHYLLFSIFGHADSKLDDLILKASVD